MTTITLFGLALAPLYAAIAEVESNNGKTSPNIYQIDEDGHGYTDDVNRILTNMRVGFVPYVTEDRLNRAKSERMMYVYVTEDRLNRAKSERMMYIYWMHWGNHYQHKTGKPVTYEVLARIHNGGPLGWKKPATLAYWAKVRAVMEGGAK